MCGKGVMGEGQQPPSGLTPQTPSNLREMPVAELLGRRSPQGTQVEGMSLDQWRCLQELNRPKPAEEIFNID